jgi:hypothetical protein
MRKKTLDHSRRNGREERSEEMGGKKPSPSRRSVKPTFQGGQLVSVRRVAKQTRGPLLSGLLLLACPCLNPQLKSPELACCQKHFWPEDRNRTHHPLGNFPQKAPFQHFNVFTHKVSDLKIRSLISFLLSRCSYS